MPINRILTDEDRTNPVYKKIIAEMYKLVPEMANNKIASALIQQAFVYELAEKYTKNHGSILSAGSYQDTAAELLRLYGYSVYDVDPVINTDLRTFKLRWHGKYQTVISTSVLEHTTDDEGFIADICDLLVPEGHAILTCDFKDGYKSGDPVPYTSNRFYTTYDLTVRLPMILEEHKCVLVDTPDYSAQDTFIWDGINYSFATYVFRKER